MIYLLYGSDTARSREKLNEIIAEYRRKNGADLSVYSFDAEEDTQEEIKRALETGSLFSNKKVVTLKHLSLSPNKELLLGALENLKDSRETIVFLWERELDEKVAAELRPYCAKMQEFKGVKKYVKPAATIFQLGDTFLTSPREGLRSLLGLLHEGHEDFNLFSYLANHARTLAIVKYYTDRREIMPGKYGIHPYVVKKAEGVVRLLPMDAPPRALKSFFEGDYRIKTGRARPKDVLIKIFFN